MYDDDECEETEMLGKVSSALSKVSWLKDDYERVKGKGSFLKKYPETGEVMDSLLDEKVKLTMRGLKKNLGEHGIKEEHILPDNIPVI